MIYRFFLFKSARIENGAISTETVLRFTQRGTGWSKFEWPAEETLKCCAPFDAGGCRADMGNDAVLSRIPVRRISRVVGYGPDDKSFEAGLVVKCHVRDRENMFAALLGFSRKHGLSIADPCFGLLLLTSEREDIRGLTWLRLRRQQVADWFSQMVGKTSLFCMGHHWNEDYYIVVHGRKSGKTNSEAAIRFRNAVREISFPDERLEPFPGRIDLVGPDHAYTIHFNWEGCGKTAEWTADFREPDCPIVPLGRISARLLRKRRCRDEGFPVGMFDPRVVACIPDPADRYASLALFNHKLTKRVPRDVVEELKRKREEKHD